MAEQRRAGLPKDRREGFINSETARDEVSLAVTLMIVGGAVYVAATVAQIVILLRLL